LGDRLEDLQRRALRMGPEGFCAQHPNPFLIRLDERGGRDEPVPWAFKTPPRGPQGTQQRIIAPAAGPAAHVYELIKSSGKGARDTITVGRTDDNDVVIAEMSISRTHASLKTGSPTNWVLVDGGSSNGTRLNGIRVSAGEPTLLSSGDVISFGDVGVLLLFPATLWEQLEQLVCG